MGTNLTLGLDGAAGKACVLTGGSGLLPVWGAVTSQASQTPRRPDRHRWARASVRWTWPRPPPQAARGRRGQALDTQAGSDAHGSSRVLGCSAVAILKVLIHFEQGVPCFIAPWALILLESWERGSRPSQGAPSRRVFQSVKGLWDRAAAEATHPPPHSLESTPGSPDPPVLPLFTLTWLCSQGLKHSSMLMHVHVCNS